MRLGSKHLYSSTPDLTPMIDVVVQLVFFFMLAINFSGDIQSELIRLPASEIARPSEGVLESPITIQALPTGKVIFGGDEMSIEELRKPLKLECDVLDSVSSGKVKIATIIIRADRDVPFLEVQRVIALCQESGFERFVFRAKPVMP